MNDEKARRMTEFLAKSIKRVYDECNRIIDEGDPGAGGKAVITRYNELLDRAKDEYPDNDLIHQLDEVTMSGARFVGGGEIPTTDDIQEVKFNSTTIADALGLDEDDFRQATGNDSLAHIEINQVQTQAQQQSTTQTVTVEQLNEHVDGMVASPDEKEELRQLVERFEEELESDDPDEVELRDVIDSAKAFSTQLAMKMAVAACERGINILIE